MFLSKKSWFQLPDFRNLSTIIQLISLSISLIFILAMLEEFKFGGSYRAYLADVAIWLSPATLMNISLLMIGNNFFSRIRLFSYIKGYLILILIIVNIINYTFYKWLATPATTEPAYFVVLNFFYLIWARYHTIIKQSVAPASIEAKLVALNSTIRPHFLFNSINSAISLIKTRPEDAEEVLQNMADLFRAMLNNKQQSTLGEELALVKDYLSIETIRLGKQRIQVNWQVNAPKDTVTPYFFLQPLLENAIYHGVENLIHPKPILVKIYRSGSWIYVYIKNQRGKERLRGSGNKKALKNLDERLFLMFSQDAKLHYFKSGNYFVVKIRLPYYTTVPKVNVSPSIEE